MPLLLASVIAALVALPGCSVRNAEPSKASCASSRFALSTDFPGARAENCSITAVHSAQVVIAPEDSPPINNSPWFAFRVSGAAQQRIEVTLNYQHGKHRYWPKVSEYGQHWRRLDAEDVVVSETGHQALLRLRLPDSGSLLVAGQPLTSSDQVLTWATEMARRSPARLAPLGQSAKGRDIVQLSSGDEHREVLLMVGRQHPPETTGWDAFTAFSQTIWGDSELARQFRRRFAVIAVPMLNPDGIDAGHWRHNTGGTDLNRDWGPFTQPETQLMQRLLTDLDQSGRQPRLFLDFHATWRNLFYTQSDANPTWPLQFAELWLEAARPQLKNYPFSQEKSRRSTQANSKNYLYGRYGIPAITYEVGDDTDPEITAAAAKIFAQEAMKLLLASAPEPPRYDVIIRHGHIIDGSGRPGFEGDIGVSNGRIATLKIPAGASAKREIDATGLWITPGFIDPHTHAASDLSAADSRRSLNYLTQGVTSLFVGNDGGGISASQLAQIDARGSGPNLGFFAGHGRIREAVMGRDNRAPENDELARMQQAVSEQMSAGALGLSTGLYYVPGSYSQTDELVALARVAADAGGVYDSHLRSESAEGLLESVGEALDIARRADIPVHISHIKALGSRAWGTSVKLVALVDEARAQGLKISANQYPWQASGTRFSNALIPRALMEGSKAQMRERLRDPAVLKSAWPQMLAALKRRGGPQAMLITGSASPHRGKTLAQLAEQQGVHPLDAAIAEILSGDPAIASFVMDLEDINTLAVQPWVVTGSDGSEGHPRKYATYPKAYQDFVRQGRLMSLERFVRRSSGQVADLFGLCDRGYLSAGLAADIALIDPGQFIPRASYEHPTELATGVRYLLVNGVLVIDDGQASQTLAGEIIRRNQLGC